MEHRDECDTHDTKDTPDRTTAVAPTDVVATGVEGALTVVERAKQAIEAILFAAGHPVAYSKLALVIGLSERDIRNLTACMAEEYGMHGLRLLLFPDTCQLCTREEFAPLIREALDIKRGGNLSASSMEVLAVVAYNQPVTRAYIDTVRGVDRSYAVSSLLDKGLLEPVGRLDAPGRPVLLGTTEKFLRVFGLSSLADLPETEALSAADAAADAAGETPMPDGGAPPGTGDPPKDSTYSDGKEATICRH